MPTQQQARRNCNLLHGLQKFHFLIMVLLKNFRVKSCVVTPPKPTFDCGVVGLDVFKQPVPIDLVAEAGHQEFTSLKLSPWLITFLLQPQTVKKKKNYMFCWCFLVYMRDGTNLTKKKTKKTERLTWWRQSVEVKVKCFLSGFLPVAQQQCLFGERSGASSPHQKRSGDPYKWTCVGVVELQQLWSQAKMCNSGRRGTERFDWLSSRSWLACEDKW